MNPVRFVTAEKIQLRWTDRITEWYHYGRFEAFLRRRPGWKVQQVESLASESLRVLRNLPDPTQPGFQGRGLVVGYVQSGKTANYTAVAARAADAGYRLVIVLSGIHDSLRTQTQIRLETELTGHRPNGVGPAKVGQRWIRLTDPDQDFDDRRQDTSLLQTTAPLLIVAKKLVPILRKLDTWVSNAADHLADMPVLIVDDEADQASINTGGNRDPSVSESLDPKESDSAPSGTNGLIRSILGRLPKAAYVGYTATPFANILIDPNGLDREVGDDLFPRHFVLQLPRPDGYTGTEELFGASAGDRDVLYEVPVADVTRLRGTRRRKKNEEVSAKPFGIPDSLVDATLAFCLVGAIRHLRGQTRTPHTMLVHVSQIKDDQRRIADALEGHLADLRDKEKNGPGINDQLTATWEQIGSGVEAPPELGRILAAAKDILHSIEIVVMNSDTGEEFDYENRPDRQIIAVGGNRLSRGLTLSGLTISYFLRTTSMCDTLLQMARWYGYRHGYADLIRIWTTDGIARWFTELALVEQSLRDSIVALERAGRRPSEMAMRLRAHSELLLTSRAKSRQAEEFQSSWSGEHPQTVLFPLNEPTRLQKNFFVTGDLLRGLRSKPNQYGGHLCRDVEPDRIIAFLENYQTHPDVVAFDSQGLANWVRSRVAADELTSWSVFLVNNSRASNRRAVAGIEVGLVHRRKINSNGIGILIDPRHEGVDLPGGPDAFRRGDGNYDTESMRAARPATQGLLIIYPLDPKSLEVESPDPVIAVAASLPRTTDLGVTWVANRGLL